MIYQIVTFLLTGISAYFLIALILVAWPFRESTTKRGIATDELDRLIAGGSLIQPAEPTFFVARDGARRLYRLYPGRGSDLLIFLHGSSSDSSYLAKFSKSLSQRPNGPTVVTLDMRGHGQSPGRRGDVDHVHQQEQDIADLWGIMKQGHRFSRFFLGGHSIGGGLAIRYASGHEQPKPDGLVLIAPFIHRKSPAARPDSGGWAVPCIPRFAGVEMFGQMGIHFFEGRPVLRFQIPPSSKNGAETPLYSWRLFKSVTPSDKWEKDIECINSCILVITAENDSIFYPDGYKDIFKNNHRTTIKSISDSNHFELSTSDEVPNIINDWLQGITRR